MTRAERLARLERLAKLMDAKYGLPGTPFQVGLDSLIGLVPGIGDAVSFLPAAFLVLEGARMGASPWVLFRMILNTLIDTVIGSIPVLGDIFDIFFRSNMRNTALLKKHLAKTSKI